MRNKAALVFVRENVALYTKLDFLFHIDTTLNVEVLPNLTNLTFGLKPQVVHQNCHCLETIHFPSLVALSHFDSFL